MITIMWIGIIGGIFGFYVSCKKTYDDASSEEYKERAMKEQLELGNTIWKVTGVIMVIVWLVQNVSIKGFNE